MQPTRRRKRNKRPIYKNIFFIIKLHWIANVQCFYVFFYSGFNKTKNDISLFLFMVDIHHHIMIPLERFTIISLLKWSGSLCFVCAFFKFFFHSLYFSLKWNCNFFPYRRLSVSVNWRFSPLKMLIFFLPNWNSFNFFSFSEWTSV